MFLLQFFVVVHIIQSIAKDYILIIVNFIKCVPTQQHHLKFCKKLFWLLKKRVLPLHRYPENNLFTLKKLIPIEDMKRSAVKPIALFFCPYSNPTMRNQPKMKMLPA